MKKIWKIIIAVLAILVLTVAGIGWYLNMHLKSMIENTLPRRVQEGSDSLYTLSYSDLSLNLLRGNFMVQDVALLPDSAVYQRLIAEQRAPKVLLNVRMETLQVSGMQLWRYFLNKEVDVGLFELSKPEINIIEDQRSVDTTTQQHNFYALANEKIKNFSLSELSLKNIRFNYTRIKKDGGKMTTKLEELDVNMQGLQIDSFSQSEPLRFLYARTFEVNLEKWHHSTPDDLYWMRLKNISYHAVNGALNIEELSLEPRYSRAEFDKLITTQKDHIDLVFNNIELKGLPNLNVLKQKLHAPKASIKGGELNIYRNKYLPFPPGNKYGNFPNQMLAKLNIPLQIDTLDISGVNINYTELSPKSGQAGTIVFLQAGGTLLNITNIDTLVAKNEHCIANLHATLMKSGRLNTHFDFILGDPSGAFGVAAQLTDMDGREFNSVARPLGMVEIESLQINKLEFSFLGNEKSAHGTLKFLYSDLKVTVLKEGKDGKGPKKVGLVSSLVNALALEDHNPSPGKALRESKPRFERDPKRSFFNLLWKTTLTGIKETVQKGAIEDKKKK